MSLLRQIEAGIEQGKVKAHLVRKALADKDINTRGIGYAVMAEDHMRAMMIEFKPKAGDPVACFEYLLGCVTEDLEWDEDYAHSREDALYELASVLDPYWTSKGIGIDPSAFWAQVTEVMRGLDGEDVATFLEGCEHDAAFDAAMQTWKSDPILQEYVPA